MFVIRVEQKRKFIRYKEIPNKKTKLFDSNILERYIHPDKNYSV